MKSQEVFKGAILVLLTLAVYFPALRSGFVWDDDTMVTDNALMETWGGLRDIWFSTRLPDYFPLTSTSFWIEWRLWEMNAAGYHLTNVLLHIGSALVLWRVLKSLAIPGAWLASLIFAVHPVNVESVAWIAERKNTLTMFFYALALFFFLRFDRDSENGGSRRLTKWYWFALLAFILALLSKTAVVMFPFVLLLCAWWKRGRVTREDLKRAAPFFLAALVMGLVTIWFQYNRAIGGEVVQTNGLAGRAATAGWAVWFYLWKALLPLKLTFIYPRWEIDARSVISYLPAGALMICLWACWLRRRTWGRPLLFGLGYFVLMLLPVAGFLNIYFFRYSLVADHWQYFSITGIIALVVGIGSWFTEKYSGKKFLRVSLAGVTIVVLSVLTWRQAGIYRDEETLWRDTIQKNSRCWLAHVILGRMHGKAGQTAEAETQYRAALRVKPDSIEAMNSLGCQLLDTGRTNEAIEIFLADLKVNPTNQLALNNLGLAFAGLGQYARAIEFYEAGLRAHPQEAKILFNLANALADAGRTDEAIRHYERLLQVQPDSADINNKLGVALVKQGKFAEALPHLRMAVRESPKDARARNNLGAALIAAGKFQEAIEQYDEALRLSPNHAGAHNNLAFVLEKQGRLDEAVLHYREALRLKSDTPEAHFNLGRLLAQQGQRAEAIEHLQEALRLKPDYENARAQLRALTAP